MGTEGWGAKVFEWTHPEQVAAEYAAVGKDAPPPTTAEDVLSAATEQTLDTAHAAGESLATGFDLAKKALIAGAFLFAGWLVLEIYREFHKRK